MEREEDNIRKPDDVKVERLISYNNEEEEDWEFQQAMEQSRKDFWEWQKEIEKEEMERQRLARDLAVPFSRLYLWKKHSSNSTELFFLDFMLKRLHHCIHNDWESLPVFPKKEPDWIENFKLFLEKHIQSSSIYGKDVYPICQNFHSPLYLF